MITRPDAKAGRGLKVSTARLRSGLPRPGSRSSARPARRRGVPVQAPPDRPGLLSGHRLRCAVPPGRARYPGPRLGQPALLGPARLARSRAGPARDPARRRRHRRHDVPDCPRARRRSGLRRADRGDPPGGHAGDLLERLSTAGAELLVATLDGIESGELEAREQPADGVSLAPKITSADAQIEWHKPAAAIDRLIRACTPDPGAWTR